MVTHCSSSSAHRVIRVLANSDYFFVSLLIWNAFFQIRRSLLHFLLNLPRSIGKLLHFQVFRQLWRTVWCKLTFKKIAQRRSIYTCQWSALYPKIECICSCGCHKWKVSHFAQNDSLRRETCPRLRPVPLKLDVELSGATSTCWWCVFGRIYCLCSRWPNFSGDLNRAFQLCQYHWYHRACKVRH